MYICIIKKYNFFSTPKRFAVGRLSFFILFVTKTRKNIEKKNAKRHFWNSNFVLSKAKFRDIPMNTHV